MHPHETLLCPVHPFTGKLPEIQTARIRALNQLGLPSVSLRESPTVKVVVTRLSNRLRRCHRKNIEWLEPTPSHHTTWLEYTHNYLIAPILQLFQQLRVREITDEMFSHAEQHGGGILKVWFTSLDFDTRKDPVHPPKIFVTPRRFPNLITTEAVALAVSPILGDIKSGSKAIFTDLKTVLIIHPRGPKQVEVEIVPLKDDLRTFRIISTAYLLEAMPPSTYLNTPKDPEGKYVFWLPPRHYDEKPLTDEEVFRTKHRISDFDILKLLDDREGAFQFFRWKRYVEQHVSPNITCAGDILECTTNGFDQQYHPPRGLFSKPIPPFTLQHMANILRPNPLSSKLRSALNDSRRFTIKLGRSLGDNNLITRIHLCRIERIDDLPIENCPELIMKIYDDRFMKMASPYDEDEEQLYDQSAKWHMRGELTAYEKMEVAQGSLIPYFYGAHKFRLPNGHEVFGILLEYIDALPLDSGCASKCSEEHRSQLMTSIRHGLRVMQYSDVSQLDWHPGQILCNIPPSMSSDSSQAHAVLIDFSATTQTLDPDVDLSNLDDYGSCASAIARLTGMDTKWVCEYWDRDEMKRECWDANSMGAVFRSGYTWSTSGVDPYKFVYDG
ncbi:hypothetical protein F5887DRAFT_951448 [Amanita rubescens]|nr:hypothetical protein F5887DRAFT_951448 [Amanita rubescens]